MKSKNQMLMMIIITFLIVRQFFKGQGTNIKHDQTSGFHLERTEGEVIVRCTKRPFEHRINSWNTRIERCTGSINQFPIGWKKTLTNGLSYVKLEGWNSRLVLFFRQVGYKFMSFQFLQLMNYHLESLFPNFKMWSRKYFLSAKSVKCPSAWWNFIIYAGCFDNAPSTTRISPKFGCRSC